MSRRLYPSVPIITMDDLYFTFDVFDATTQIFSITKYAGDLRHDVNSLFRFDFDVGSSDFMRFGMCDELRVRWNVVLKEWKGVFIVMDCKGKGTLVSCSSEKWFSEELPSAGCCLASEPTGVVAELGFGLCKCNEGSKMMKVDKLCPCSPRMKRLHCFTLTVFTQSDKDFGLVLHQASLNGSYIGWYIVHIKSSMSSSLRSSAPSECPDSPGAVALQFRSRTRLA
ncbi:hypothetical protein FRX31_019201 [Thalictrum thalictroides]|uniref:Uncharacterized protein n=1 Tax=Thalictrum thalictroides TaxID=46969 RepID=A0A7J6W281_THATH|nr:hypothetical protein FRX31_019201 [Thalictrum thalictroides]